MNIFRSAVASAMAISLASCAQTTIESSAMPANGGTPLAIAQLADQNGTTVGTADIISLNGEPTVRLTLANLKPGIHAWHLHTTGKCEAPAFSSAGGHLNPFAREHGRDNPNGKHLGDMPNVTVGPFGEGSGEFALDISATELSELIFDGDGTAMMLHAGPDDYRSDPAGAAGPRIACGVLERPQ